MHFHFKLLKDCEFGKKDAILSVETEAERKQLVKLGLAEECAAPPADDDAVTKAATEVATKLGEQVGKAVDAAMKNVLETTKKGIEGLSLPATPRDHDVENMAGFKFAGEFWKAVQNAGTPGKGVDDRLNKWNEKRLGELQSKAPSGLNTNDGSDGGYLVPTTINNQIMELVWDSAGIPARCDRFEIPGGSMVLKANDETSRATGSRRGGVRAYWLSEADQYTATKPKWREITLKPNKLGVFYYATDEQIADTTGLSLENKLAQYAAEEIDWLLVDSILTGDGIGKPLGIVNAPGTIEIAKETSQTAATVNFVNIRKMYFRMMPRSRAKSVWLVNSDVLPQLMTMTFPDAAGTLPVMLQGLQYPNISGGPLMTLMGRPLIEVEQAQTLGTVGDIMLADLSMYALGTKGSVRSAMSIHIRFDYGEQAFRFDFRADGQPWLNSAVTAAKGSATYSPFITLATRA